VATRSADSHLCSCGHDDATHIRYVDRCLGTDSYGFACECISFEHSDSCTDFDNDGEEDEGDERPTPHPEPSTHYRHLVDDNGRVDREEPE
jgi:hypothetical protein